MRLAVAEGDEATFEGFRVDADPCRDEGNLWGETRAKCHTDAVSSRHSASAEGETSWEALTRFQQVPVRATTAATLRQWPCHTASKNLADINRAQLPWGVGAGGGQAQRKSARFKVTGSAGRAGSAGPQAPPPRQRRRHLATPLAPSPAPLPCGHPRPRPFLALALLPLVSLYSASALPFPPSSCPRPGLCCILSSTAARTFHLFP